MCKKWWCHRGRETRGMNLELSWGTCVACRDGIGERIAVEDEGTCKAPNGGAKVVLFSWKAGSQWGWWKETDRAVTFQKEFSMRRVGWQPRGYLEDHNTKPSEWWWGSKFWTKAIADEMMALREVWKVEIKVWQWCRRDSEREPRTWGDPHVPYDLIVWTWVLVTRTQCEAKVTPEDEFVDACETFGRIYWVNS